MKGQHLGAIWHKCDFQIHTPRDAQWQGSPALPGGNPDAEAARYKWAEDFVSACLERGLSAISVSDHHDFCFAGYVQETIDRLKMHDRLWLFPGLEVTCNDSVQCLLIFDVGSDAATLHRVFGGHLQNIQMVPNGDAQAPQTELCGKDIGNFITGVQADTALSSRSVILPNASDGGYKTILRAGFHTRFKELPFDGVYVDGSYDSVGEVAREKIFGEIEAWGSRRRGILPTGDNRRASWEKLGTNPCWIRLGEPTAEAIRQAVLADKARITYQPPTPPTQRVLAMAVSSTLLGEDFSLVFNDGFNALIGGRGSGKSAILEYLRFGIGRAAADIAIDSDSIRSRENDLIQNTLIDGHVEIDLVRDGVREIWRRDLSSRGSILVTLPDGSKETISVAAAQERFRARGFYQKQLSTLVSDEVSASEQITGIASAESVNELRNSEREIETAKRQVQRFLSQMVEYWIAEASLKRDRSRVADIRRRIEAIRKKLEESGIKPETQAILDEAPIYSLTDDLVAEAAVDIEEDTKRLHELKASLPSVQTDGFSKSQVFPEVKSFLAEVELARTLIQQALDTALEAALRLDGAQHILAVDFQTSKKAFSDKHEGAIAQQAHAATLVAELQALNADLQSAEAAERRSAASLKALEQVPDEFAQGRTAFSSKVSAHKQLLATATERVKAMSGAVLEARVRTEGRPRQYVSALLTICEGSRIRDAEGKCEAIVEKLAPDSLEAGWNEIADRLLKILKEKSQSPNPIPVEISEEATQEIANIFGAITSQQTASVFAQISPASVSDALNATTGAFIAFDYKDRNGLIPFKQASPGQQAAALLHLLLHQQAGTLIIDQPEDDLDNRTIMGIVDLLQTTKQQRQLIFATHNPNFVVNGDADKIVALVPDSVDVGTDQRRISIDTDGAIETATVRKAITEIMEGGEHAFELRSRKYQFL